MRSGFLLFFVISLSSIQAHAYYTSLVPSVRIYPVGGSIEGMLGKDWYLYDQRNPKEFWKFGLISLQVKAASHGLIDTSLSVYPISFIKIFLGLGGTYRYYNSSSMDCTQNICQGFFSRTRFGFSFLFSFGEQSEYLILPKFQSIAVSHSQTNRRLVDETELLTAAAGGDTLNQVTLFMGNILKKGNILGFYMKQSQYQNSQKQNEMQLIVMNWDWKQTSLIFGIGRYASDFHVPGITATAEYTWKWGNGLSLF